ncbi:class I SAM-dependent DNA methyltransferase [Sphingomonas profundi]|uniref:class I SAM-dependent DNA methyltransferase n=1 Tax=Alterirhizorhabdus profundi TaxID=2681549 RepID=UPI0012E94212|nr:DNA methyltransferase [Sphingomonas profundi]
MNADEFIAKWQGSGGNERANTQLFVTDLCALLGVERPQPTQSDTARNDYVFERHVVKTEIDGATSNGWIDLYKRDCFVLEAKQGSAADAAAVDAGKGDSLRDLFGQTAAERFKRGMARRGTEQWTGAMLRAAGQADGYARALPDGHDWPPFLLVSDVGYCIDLYANFARDGRPYAPFPDRRRYRITLEELRDEDVRARLAAIWTAPMSLDPSVEAARVTREVADHLAVLAKDIEAREQNADRVAAFLMRLLFTMFAEDTGLIPKKSFSALLKKVRDRPENLPPQLTDLWKAMDKGNFAHSLGESGETVRRFNGYLFKDTTAIALTAGEIDVLIKAAKADWRQVEPAIFGTLLERALNPKERAKLGAHYTPRAYVERLVGPTIMEPLREDWLGARTSAMEAAEAGDREKARLLVEAFHTKLAQTKVLDPACGTGNFLYVAMARMKELEGEVLELLEELGDARYLAELGGHTITPENFLGIEINPRAAAIAQLVLWIGYLQWHFRVNGEERMPEPPVLRDVKTIMEADALLEWDDRVLVRDERGAPVSIWDGTSMKKHPVTGRLVPDEAGRREVYRYVNPKRRSWPKADFIVGNPPFIGSKRMRKRLSSPYVDAVRTAYHDLSGEIDFVTYWWARSAALAAKGHVRAFGLITTKTIAQSSNRPVLRQYLEAGGEGLRMAFAIPNHPWHDPETTAAVRIAMTVGVRGEGKGRLSTIKFERRQRREAILEFEDKIGVINIDLTIGPNVAAAKALKANSGICWMGVKMSGDGFKFGSAERVKFLQAGIPPFRMPLVIAGTDITEAQSETFAFDFFDVESGDALLRDYPAAFQHLYDHVKPERDENDREQYRLNWWRFAETRPRLRSSVRGLGRYIVTSETSSHRFFKFNSADGVLADGSVIVTASDDACTLGLVSSRAHVVWALRAGGRMGAGDDPRYQNEVCFDPFPFPDFSDETLRARIRDAAEKLDGLRKEVLARHADLTLTKLYNALEALRATEAAGAVLGDRERDLTERGCVSLIRHYHDEIDAAVSEAYGWPADVSDDAILERLVALNKERAAEEAKGKVRWLRPEFQAPAYVAPAEQVALALPEDERPSAEVLEWPGALPEQVVAVAGVVGRAAKPLGAGEVARAFRGKRAATVAPVLDALAGIGRVRKLEDGRYAA